MDVFLSVFDVCTLAGFAVEWTTAEVVDVFGAVEVDGVNNGTDRRGVVFHLEVIVTGISIRGEVADAVVCYALTGLAGSGLIVGVVAVAHKTVTSTEIGTE